MLVALNGVGEAGKDTAALGLIEQGWVRLAFADVLKEFARRIGWDGRKDAAGRQFLEDIGAGAREILDPYVWVKPVHRQILHHRERGEHVVITDMRYPNEADMVRQLGGYTLEVLRPGCGPKGPSDLELIKAGWEFDGTLFNVVAPEDLQRRLCSWVNEHRPYVTKGVAYNHAP